MSELEDIATYIFMWNSLSDACPKCRSLNMREYRDQSIYQNVLWDSWYGNVWDLNRDRSLMHGASGTCRCQLTVRVEFDWSNWDALKEMHEAHSLFMVLPGVA